MVGDLTDRHMDAVPDGEYIRLVDALAADPPAWTEADIPVATHEPWEAADPTAPSLCSAHRTRQPDCPMCYPALAADPPALDVERLRDALTDSDVGLGGSFLEAREAAEQVAGLYSGRADVFACTQCRFHINRHHPEYARLAREEGE
jgi:hypothetical protein